MVQLQGLKILVQAFDAHHFPPFLLPIHLLIQTYNEESQKPSVLLKRLTFSHF
ncbi:hypothetical protein Hanom_Chr04g00368571 [Helianthus anomalus]